MVLGTAASESCVAAIEAMRFPRMRTVWSLSSAPVATLITVTWRIEVSGAGWACAVANATRSEEHTSELQSLRHLVCRLLLEKHEASSRWSLWLQRAQDVPQGERPSTAR